MPPTVREATEADVPALAAIRSREWQTEDYWNVRIFSYLFGDSSPRRLLSGRTAFVAAENSTILGFVAGHLTNRFDCHGELEWINVIPEKRGQGIVGQLIERMAAWFVGQNAVRICIDPDEPARSLYAKFGATALNRHWMVWEDSRQMLARATEINRKNLGA